MNGTAKWVAIIVSVIVAAVGFTYAVATDSVNTVAARLDTTCERVNELERDSTEVKTDIKYLVRMIEDLTRKVDKALEE